jgi:hypothetical protein
MGAQAHVIGDRTIGPYAAQAGIVPVEIRHWIILSFARDSLGRQGGAAVGPRCPDGANLMPEGVGGKMVATI